MTYLFLYTLNSYINQRKYEWKKMDGLTPLTLNFAILIVTATIFVIIARKTKQPPLVAYIFTGVALGPVALNIVTETASIELFSKLGLGFLLFLLGLEMKIKDIRKILKPIIRISILQTIMQTALAFIVAYLLGFPLMHTTIIALCTVFGATPVIVKVLADQNKIKTLPGRINVGVLIIQDIILVIYLALFSTGTLTDPSIIGYTLLRVFLMIGLIGILVVITSKYLLSGLFGRVAENKHAFFIIGITWAFAFITLGHVLGVSIEVGAFLAGLGLGQIPFHKELQERTRPLTNFFLVIFFASIGLQLTTQSLFAYWKEAVITSAVLMIGNFLIMFYLIDREKFTPRTSFLGSINMTQVSEFSLVVGGIAIVQGYIPADLLGYFSLMALITMTLSTYLITYNEKIYERVKHIFERFESEDKKDVEMETLENHALIVGYNETADKIIPTLREHFEQIGVVDKKIKNVEKLEEKNLKYIFGDFKHEEIQREMGLREADLIISFAKEDQVNKEILRKCKEKSIVFIESESPEESEEYYDMGADYIIRKNILTAEKIKGYLENYLKNLPKFISQIDRDTESLIWGSKSS